MKKSEFIRRAMNPGTTVQVISEELAIQQAALAEEAARELLRRIARTDITEVWDPEEPELPRRVQKSEASNLLVPEGQGMAIGGGIERAIAFEAVARYNAWERLCELFRFHGLPGEAERFLAEERSRL